MIEILILCYHFDLHELKVIYSFSCINTPTIFFLVFFHIFRHEFMLNDNNHFIHLMHMQNTYSISIGVIVFFLTLIVCMKNKLISNILTKVKMLLVCLWKKNEYGTETIKKNFHGILISYTYWLSVLLFNFFYVDFTLFF